MPVMGRKLTFADTCKTNDLGLIMMSICTLSLESEGRKNYFMQTILSQVLCFISDETVSFKYEGVQAWTREITK